MREHNLYFTALSVWDSLRLLFGAVTVLCFGNRGYAAAAASLERQFARRFEAEDAVAFPSARVGIALLLRALGIGTGDEVLITGYTCTAVPTAVLAAGATPSYVDVEPESFAMDPDSARAAITPRTRAILIQHTYGFPARVAELSALARSCGLVFLEDAVLGLGSRLGAQALGTFGDASIFSFELSKTITAG